MNTKARQLTSIIKIFELKKGHFKNNIYKANQLIEKKIASIQTLTQYAASYADKLDDASLTTIQIIKNNRLFYQQLQQVIQTEKKEIEKLEAIKRDLVSKYLGFDKKISGLNTVYDGIVETLQIARSHAEDAENFDQAITRRGIDKKWEN